MPAPLYGADDARNCSGSSIQGGGAGKYQKQFRRVSCSDTRNKSRTDVPTRYTTRAKTGEGPNKRNSNETVAKSDNRQIP
ncbi:DUF2856 family protein [Escherichia coli]|nr:DUF2856 family protein [Escherichia coli]